MKNIIKKLLVTTAAFIVMSGSLGVGTLRVLAEQYYGWEDGTQKGGNFPAFLYVAPKDKPARSTDKQFIVYCFNRENIYPPQWEEQYYMPSTLPQGLPVYDKIKGDDSTFKKHSKSQKSALTATLVAILQNGFPNKRLGNLNENQSRRLTQLAIWCFTDNYSKHHFKTGYSLTEEEDKLLQDLIKLGEQAPNEKKQPEQTLDIYVTTIYSQQHKPYQNLLGSTLIPKTPEEPKVPDPKVPEVPKKPEPKEPEKPKTPEEPKPTPKPEIPKKEDLGTVIGGGNVVETTEDTATVSQGGAHNGIVSIQENKDPIVEETYESPLPGQSGQSGSTTEVEDTKGADVLIGGQGEIVDFEETLSAEQGQSGSTTEVEDTKGADVMIGGQGEIVEFEETLPTEQGQSGSATEVEDTKGPDVMIGGQGEIVEFEETLPNEHGQSSSTTEVEDSKPKISIHFDNEWPKEEKPQLPAVEKPKAKVSLPATGEAEHVLSTIVGAMILFLVSLWGLLKRKASKA
ncbi:thioester-forming surface-anchored protein [Streptococcus dysgalactiae]|uniref:thioester-forming surface-anchored protein n=1 Tax=Streptococcus dysgalactiae TaxID=1334 RepID=UPI002DD4495F|nr:thioester-forming surface-anchored protein [Streptococcus dysgalactiae]MEC4577686.1 thioester-forming surface-anchored protein [Streptococcus dysgalactiae]